MHSLSLFWYTEKIPKALQTIIKHNFKLPRMKSPG